MSETFSEINISEIDLDDRRYKISSADNDIEFLALSVKEQGLINPPSVRPFNGKYIVVSGFRRIRAVMYNKAEKIPVRKIDSGNIGYLSAVRAISDNSFQRLLNSSELIRGVKLLNKFIDKEEIARRSSFIFNRELNRKIVGDLINIGSMPWNETVLALIDQGRLSLKPAMKISVLDRKTIKGFIYIFSRIKTGLNNQLDIIRFFREISAREKIALFDDRDILKIVNLDNRDSRTRLLKSHLYKRRYPFLSKATEDIREKIKALKLRGIEIKSPENFEDTVFSASFVFKDIGEFREKSRKMESVSKNPLIREIFNED